MDKKKQAKNEPKLETTEVKGVMTVLMKNLYKSHYIIVRRIYENYFEYLLEYNGDIYSSYIIIKPEKGKKKLTKVQVNECMSLIYNGGMATLDALLGDTDVSEKDKEYVELFEKYREKPEDKKDGKN